jgi:hypothetical protein
METKSIEADTLTLDCSVLMGISSDNWQHNSHNGL